MTKEELAAKLSGRSYGSEITKHEEEQAKASGLVVVFGYSDDGVELRGAISDEISAYNGTSFAVTSKGLVENKCDEEDCPYFEELMEAATKIVARWCEEGDGGPLWSYTTTIPHATFEIREDNDFYCRGIVFSLSEVA